ncbi:MAG: 30S ribosomal protein S6 [Eubacteriales bacterium]|nr:30S ribosomal protein S6 [Eubacteriales bacterium]
MRKYELLYVLNPQLGAEGLTEMNEKIQNMVKEAAQNVEVDDWGIRQLAYEIEDQREGNYVIVQFESDAEFPSELERVLRINDKVLRFLVTRVDA